MAASERQRLLQPQDRNASASSISKDALPPSSSSSSSSSSLEEASIGLTTTSTPSLPRTLTWPSAYILAMSRVVGSGIFATPGTIARAAGSPGLSLSLWLAGALVAACGLAVALELGCALPRSGGNKVYLEFAYRWPRLLAPTLFAIYSVFLGFTASNCVVFGRYVLFALGVRDEGDWEVKGLAVGLLSVVTIVHGVFPRTGIRIQNALGWIKMGVILFMVLSGLYVVLVRPTPDSTSSSHRNLLSWDDLWRDTNWDWAAMSTGLFQVFYSYAGLDNVSNVLNEVKDPVKTLRSVALAALGTACGLYFLVNVAYFLVVPFDEVRDSAELVAALFFERLFGESVGRTLLPLAVALSAGGNVMVVAFAMVSPQVPKHIYPIAISPYPGPNQARNRPPRLPPLWRHPLLLSPLQLPPRRLPHQLHPLDPRHRPPALGRRLRLHPAGRGLRQRARQPGRGRRPAQATGADAGAQEAV